MSRAIGLFDGKKDTALKLTITKKAFEQKVRDNKNLTKAEVESLTTEYLEETMLDGRSFIQWAVRSGNVHNAALLVKFTPARVDIFEYFLSRAYQDRSSENVKAMAATLVSGIHDPRLYPSMEDLDKKIEECRDRPATSPFYELKISALKEAITVRLRETHGAAVGRAGK